MLPGAPPSLLWPDSRRSSTSLSDNAIDDLQLGRIVDAVALPDASPGRRAARERFARGVLGQLLTDADIIQYRQAVLAELVADAALSQRLEELLPCLESLAEAPRSERYRPTAEPGLERVARRLSDLELLVETVAGLSNALDEAAPQSPGLQSAQSALRGVRSSPDFEALERELPALRETLGSVRSVIVGVNLGPDLAPESATILELGTIPVEGRRALLFRLLGTTSAERGLTPLQRGEASPLGRPNELVRDLRHLLADIVSPVANALDRFARLSTAQLGDLAAELGLFLGAARLCDRLDAVGLPVCWPTCLDRTERRTDVSEAYDLGLALSQLDAAPAMVTNTIQFGADPARVWVLTGPNRGGKTTYTRAVGVAQVLFQAGLFVPARSAWMSPVDGIFTHFPTTEDARPGLGRLDVEAERLAAIFRQATPRSLILLNEALSGTSALEALDLARGLVRALRMLGARAIYVTHLHELAAEADHINRTTDGDGRVGSLLAEARTFCIVARPPRGVSFAAEIAEQHGISFSQLEQLLRERNL
jgi:DNA mismatch repair protein MutS